MCFKTNILVAIVLIIGLNAEEGNASIERHLEDGRSSNPKDRNTRRILKQINMERFRDQYRQRDENSLDEELEWLETSELYNGGRIAMALRGRNIFDEALIPIPSKKASTSRLCGTKLVEAIIKLCNGCVKPVGGKAVSTKRCKLDFIYHSCYMVCKMTDLILLAYQLISDLLLKV
uniref:Gnk2-homologous domain-containing protein n=1 Tax=Setaria digitata TaxID=48799 RepID=A0A915PX30_9BILA